MVWKWPPAVAQRAGLHLEDVQGDHRGAGAIGIDNRLVLEEGKLFEETGHLVKISADNSSSASTDKLRQCRGASLCL